MEQSNLQPADGRGTITSIVSLPPGATHTALLSDRHALDTLGTWYLTCPKAQERGRLFTFKEEELSYKKTRAPKPNNGRQNQNVWPQRLILLLGRTGSFPRLCGWSCFKQPNSVFLLPEHHAICVIFPQCTKSLLTNTELRTKSQDVSPRSVLDQTLKRLQWISKHLSLSGKPHSCSPLLRKPVPRVCVCVDESPKRCKKENKKQK